jgi:uncharacterized protein
MQSKLRNNVWQILLAGTLLVFGCNNRKSPGDIDIRIACEKDDTNFFYMYPNLVDKPVLGRSSGELTYPVLIAASSESFAVLKQLIQHDVDLTVRDWSSNTVFIKMAEVADSNAIPLLKLLLSKGADINARNNSGFTALHYAVISGPPEIVQFLVNEGAKVDALDVSGSTPLHYAESIENAHVLLKAGASLTVRNLAGKTPAENANDNRKEVQKVLKAAEK